MLRLLVVALLPAVLVDASSTEPLLPPPQYAAAEFQEQVCGKIPQADKLVEQTCTRLANAKNELTGSALALRGGGWRAVAGNLGVLEAMKKWAAEPNHALPDHFLANSGGAWTMAGAMMDDALDTKAVDPAAGLTGVSGDKTIVGPWDLFFKDFKDFVKHAKSRDVFEQSWGDWWYSRYVASALPFLYKNELEVYMPSSLRPHVWRENILSWWRNPENLLKPFTMDRVDAVWKELGVKSLSFVASGMLYLESEHFTEIMYSTFHSDGVPEVADVSHPADWQSARYNIVQNKLNLPSWFHTWALEPASNKTSVASAMARSSFAAGGVDGFLSENYEDEVDFLVNDKTVNKSSDKVLRVYDGGAVDNPGYMPALRSANIKRVIAVGTADGMLNIGEWLNLYEDHFANELKDKEEKNVAQEIWQSIMHNADHPKDKNGKVFALDSQIDMLFGIHHDQAEGTVGISDATSESSGEYHARSHGAASPGNWSGNQVFPLAVFFTVARALDVAHKRGNGVVATFRLKTIPAYGSRVVDLTLAPVSHSENWDKELKQADPAFAQELHDAYLDKDNGNISGFPRKVSALSGASKRSYQYAVRHLAGWIARKNKNHFRTANLEELFVGMKTACKTRQECKEKLVEMENTDEELFLDLTSLTS